MEKVLGSVPRAMHLTMPYHTIPDCRRHNGSLQTDMNISKIFHGVLVQLQIKPMRPRCSIILIKDQRYNHNSALWCVSSKGSSIIIHHQELKIPFQKFQNLCIH